MRKFQFFSDWLNLNQVIKEEMKGQSLRDLASWGAGEHNPVFSDLSTHYKRSFLVMTEQDEKSLKQSVFLFKLIKQKHATMCFVMQNCVLENDAWKMAYAAYEWAKNPAYQSEFTSEIDNLLSTLIQVFILRMCTTAYSEIHLNSNP